jgi:hypothetical protein
MAAQPSAPILFNIRRWRAPTPPKAMTGILT